MSAFQLARVLSAGALCDLGRVVLRMNSVGADLAPPASGTPAFTMAGFVFRKMKCQNFVNGMIVGVGDYTADTS